MPKLQCQFCGYEWEQPALAVWCCPSCELGSAREYVREATEQDISALWSCLKTAYLELAGRSQLEGHVGYFAGDEVADLRREVDLLVLVFDSSIIPNLYSLDIPDDDPLSQRLIEYHSHGAIVPLDQGPHPFEPFFEYARTSLQKRIAHHGGWISMGQCRRPFFLYRENLMKILAHLDFQRDGVDDSHCIFNLGNRRPLYERLLSRGFVRTLLPKQFWKADLPDRIVNRLNGDLVTSQLFSVPMVTTGALEEVLRWKLGVDSEKGLRTQYDVLKHFLRSLSVPVPLRARDVLSLRESRAGQELRHCLHQVCSYAKDPVEAVKQLHDEYLRLADDLQRRARSFSDVSNALLVGAMSSVAAIMGGTAGAVVGGIGATAVSLGTRALFRRIYEATHKNWAYYFARWSRAVRPTQDCF